MGLFDFLRSTNTAFADSSKVRQPVSHDVKEIKEDVKQLGHDVKESVKDLAKGFPIPTKIATAPTGEVIAVDRKERVAIVEEIIKPIETHEIQPVILREREKLEVQEVVQPIYEKAELPITYHDRELPSEVRPEVRMSADEYLRKVKDWESGFKSVSRTEEVSLSRVEKPAIVKEVIKKQIIEEIQPVIHREIIEPHVWRETRPIYERIVESPTVVIEKREPIVRAPPTGALLTTTTTTEKKGLFANMLGKKETVVVETPVAVVTPVVVEKTTAVVVEEPVSLRTRIASLWGGRTIVIQ